MCAVSTTRTVPTHILNALFSPQITDLGGKVITVCLSCLPPCERLKNAPPLLQGVSLTWAATGPTPWLKYATRTSLPAAGCARPRTTPGRTREAGRRSILARASSTPPTDVNLSIESQEHTLHGWDVTERQFRIGVCESPANIWFKTTLMVVLCTCTCDIFWEALGGHSEYGFLLWDRMLRIHILWRVIPPPAQISMYASETPSVSLITCLCNFCLTGELIHRVLAVRVPWGCLQLTEQSMEKLGLLFFSSCVCIYMTIAIFKRILICFSLRKKSVQAFFLEEIE